MKDWGDREESPIILLHGSPYDIRAWDDVAPPLADAGYLVLVPYLRGYGHTQFRNQSAPRMAEQAAIGQDVIDFANVLGLERFALAWLDWGNRTACITSILHPGRMRAQVPIGGYSVQNTAVPSVPGPAATEAWHWSSGPKSLLQNTLTGPDWSNDVHPFESAHGVNGTDPSLHALGRGIGGQCITLSRVHDFLYGQAARGPRHRG